MPPSARPSSTRAPERGADKRAAPLVDALAQAAWAEADAALAEALIECDRVMQARNEGEREEALGLLSLALSRAARRRGLSRFGKSGSLEDFDANKHDLPADLKRKPKRVRIMAPGVARGAVVLVKAEVKPARTRRA